LTFSDTERLALIYVEKSYAELITSDADGVGYLLKDRVMRVEEFLVALERVGNGGTAFDPEVVRQLLARTSHTDPLSKLTDQERDARPNGPGHQRRHRGGTVRLAESAVEKHVNAIFDKLSLSQTTGYSRRALAVLRYLGT
jgi:DNA-binding NarL/FixJ family response regulator